MKYFGISQVKRAKIDLFTSKYENFKMHENEATVDMFTRFNKITNGLIFLGEPSSNNNKISKILCSLSKS